MATGRQQQRSRVLRIGWLVAAALVVIAILFALGGHWILAILTAAVAVAAVWLVMQLRTVR
jgi:hypothetical protein